MMGNVESQAGTEIDYRFVDNGKRYDVKCFLCNVTLAEAVQFSEAKKICFQHEEEHQNNCVRIYPLDG